VSLCFCVAYLFIYLLECGFVVFFVFCLYSICEVVTFLAIAIESFIRELTTRFPASHLMNVMGICYLQYWLQGDAKKNFNQHLLLIKVHYCSKKPLELVKTSKASLPFVVEKILLSNFVYKCF